MTTQRKDSFNKAISFIKREGINQLVNWLETETDYFTAPASTNFHGNYEGGLLDHCLNVTRFALHNLNMIVKEKPELESLRESAIICGLFHDVCKTNNYFLTKKWTKDDAGKWKEYIGYEVRDSFPLGHGEKSVFLISKFITLTDEEALAIRWHMGATEVSTMMANTPQNYAYSAARDYPLVNLIISADMLTLSIEEKKDLKNA